MEDSFMDSWFDTLSFSLPTAVVAQCNDLSYEDYVFETKIEKHKHNPRRLAVYIAEYMKFTDKPLSNKVMDIIKPHKLKKSSKAVFYLNDKGEYRGFNFK